jgi:DNA-binding NtrC family response regulator
MMERAKHKVLIVDDEPEVREVLSKLLPRKLQVEVMDVGDGESAVSLTREFKPDLILLDIRLPGAFWGWQVVEEIRKFDTTVKFVIITGMSTVPEEQKHLVREHVADFVFKPLVIDEVIETVVNVLGSDCRRNEALFSPAATCGPAPDKREIVHELVNVHSRIRLKCEGFLLNYEDGCFKGRSDSELLQETLDILKKTIAAIDRAAVVIERIRQL